MDPQNSRLDIPLQKSQTNADEKSRIAKRLWNFEIEPNYLDGTRTFGRYFSYYIVQCDLALHDGGRHTSARTCEDILKICELFGQDISRPRIRDRLKSQYMASANIDLDAMIESSIDLAVRLLLMINIGPVRHGFLGRKELLWQNGSLKEFVRCHFDQSQAFALERVNLEKQFMACNLKRIACIRIIWTDNLADHLRLQEDDTQVYIFHHASFLQMARHR